MTAAVATKKPKKARRQYGVASDGKTPVVSVTTVLSSLGWSKDSLMFWASGVAVDEAIRMLLAGMPLHEVQKLAKGAHVKLRDAAADAGTAAHAMIEAYVKGEDPDDAYDPMLPAETLEKALRAYDKFVAWWTARLAEGWRVVETEMLMVDRDMGYGGTCDLILRAPNGDIVVADVKTGKRYYDEVALQLAAYGCLARKHGHNVVRGLVIHVPVDGEASFPEVPPMLLQQMAAAFGALLIVHNAKKLIKFDNVKEGV